MKRQHWQNVVKVCDFIGLDVPVAWGAEEPLHLETREIAPDIDGNSGLDGPELTEVPKKMTIDKHAVDFLLIERLLDSDGGSHASSDWPTHEYRACDSKRTCDC